ncbi:MAG: hypothetical protein ACKPKO_60970 [Candidatus Fonsibacter sp.]
MAKVTARLKLLADKQHNMRSKADVVQKAIAHRQAELECLNAALAKLEKGYAETAAACAPIALKRAAEGAEGTPAVESINALDSISKILDNGDYLNASYAAYVTQCEGAQMQPEPARRPPVSRWQRPRSC